MPIPWSQCDTGPREAFHPPDLDVPVAAVSQQRVGQAGAVSPPAVVDAEHNLRQAWWPPQQELMAHALQVAHHQLQDASIGQVLQQERMHILLLCPGREKEPDLNEGPSVPGSPIFFGRGERGATAGAGWWQKKACAFPSSHHMVVLRSGCRVPALTAVSKPLRISESKVHMKGPISKCCPVH